MKKNNTDFSYNKKGKKINKKISKKIYEISNQVSEKTKTVKEDIASLTFKASEDEKIKKLKEDYNKTIDRADEIKEEIIGRLEEQADEFETSEKFTIFGLKIWKFFAYLVIYSFLGYVLETIYGLLTKGVLESRQSFMYGPFCSIYGIGAVIMIISLQPLKKNNYTLFFGGYIIGSIIEYFVSLFGEMILHVKWWDYSNEPFNIGGRICLFYSLAWGILAIYLITHLHPMIDKYIDKLKKKLPKIALPIFFDVGVIFLVFDCLISAYALNTLYQRLVYDYNINIENSEYYRQAYEKTMENKWLYDFKEKHFSNEKMLKTHPNLKIQTVDGEIIFVRNILSDIKPYYYKFFTPGDNFKLTNVETVTYEENK